MTKTEKAIQIFSESYHSESSKNMFIELKHIIDEIENMDDPPPHLLRFYEASNELFEKLSLVEGLLKQMSIEKNRKLLGNVLDDLYSNSKYTNTGVIFE
jgi:hypothetical protein